MCSSDLLISAHLTKIIPRTPEPCNRDLKNIPFFLKTSPYSNILQNVGIWFKKSAKNFKTKKSCLKEIKNNKRATKEAPDCVRRRIPSAIFHSTRQGLGKARLAHRRPVNLRPWPMTAVSRQQYNQYEATGRSSPDKS